MERFSQLRVEARVRQGAYPRLGLTEKGWGMVQGEAAALSVHIFSV